METRNRKRELAYIGTWMLALCFVGAITFLLGFEIHIGMANTVIHLLFSILSVYTVVLVLSLVYLVKKARARG